MGVWATLSRRMILSQILSQILSEVEGSEKVWFGLNPIGPLLLELFEFELDFVDAGAEAYCREDADQHRVAL